MNDGGGFCEGRPRRLAYRPARRFAHIGAFATPLASETLRIRERTGGPDHRYWCVSGSERPDERGSGGRARVPIAHGAVDLGRTDRPAAGRPPRPGAARVGRRSSGSSGRRGRRRTGRRSRRARSQRLSTRTSSSSGWPGWRSSVCTVVRLPFSRSTRIHPSFTLTCSTRMPVTSDTRRPCRIASRTIACARGPCRLAASRSRSTSSFSSATSLIWTLPPTQQYDPSFVKLE